MKYKAGIEIIDKALATPICVPSSEEIERIGDQFSEATKIVHKLKCARGEVLIRIGTLYRNADKRQNEELFPSKRSDSISSGSLKSVMRPRTFAELAEALRSMQNNSQSLSNLIELLFSCEGVKLYYIENRGEVTSSLEDTTLRIVRIGADEDKHLEETIFIQIIKTSDSYPIEIAQESKEASPNKSEEFVFVQEENGVTKEYDGGKQEDNCTVDPSFIYPLLRGISPCYRTEFGAFILPDLQSTDGGAIGLMFPIEEDQIFSEILITLLDGVVKDSGAIEFGEIHRHRGSLSDSVSSNIVKGASYVSQGLVYSAEKAGQLMSYTTPYLISKMKRAPTSDIPDNVHTGIKVAKTVTGAAAKGTCYLAGKVGEATTRFGRFLAPHVQRQGSRILSGAFGLPEEDAQEKVTDCLKIAAGAVEGFGTVYTGLETSATILGTHLSNNTVQIVEHKYGSQAGMVVENTLDTVGNLINVNKNFGIVTAKGFFKSAGKNAGKGILHDLKPKTYVNEEYVSASSLYPDLSQLAEKMNSMPSTSKSVARID